jgi:hypothetical protein
MLGCRRCTNAAGDRYRGACQREGRDEKSGNTHDLVPSKMRVDHRPMGARGQGPVVMVLQPATDAGRT